MNLLDLNDDCLIEIGKNCDENSLFSLMDTCERMRRILIESVFPTRKKHLLVVLRPSILRKIIKYIGPYTAHLTIHLLGRNWYKEKKIAILRWLNELSKCVGDLSKTVVHSRSLPSSWIGALKPIFDRSEELNIYSQEFDTLFFPVSPKIKHFKMAGFCYNDVSLKSFDTFTSLETLDLRIGYHDYNERIIMMSPQLKRLIIDGASQFDLGEISTRLKDLEELVIFANEIYDFSPLKTLKKLTNVQIRKMNLSRPNPSLIFNWATNIRVLKIEVSNAVEDPFFNLWVKTNMEEFSTCNLSPYQFGILSLVNEAPNLTKLHIHRSGCSIDLELLLQLEKWRDSNHPLLTVYSEDQSFAGINDELTGTVVWKQCNQCCVYNARYHPPRYDWGS